MSLFGWMTGSKSPDPGVPVLGAEAVRAAILAVNRADAPFEVREGRPDEADLVSEWRIVDARWQPLFGEAGLTRVAKVLMRLDEGAHKVRSIDQEWSVEWSTGVPGLTLAASGSKGQLWSREAAVSFGVNREGRFVKNYAYRFSTGELKEPLKAAVLACGWEWHGVLSGL